MIHRLQSGRVVQTVFRDKHGQPKFLEILDTRTNARRIFYGPNWTPQDERSRSAGLAVSEDDLPELMAFYLEDEQTYWRPVNDQFNLITLPGAFPWCKPEVGDVMYDHHGAKYEVQSAPGGNYDCPWNGLLLLSNPVPEGVKLRWSEEAAQRTLVSFVAEEGKPSSPTPGEETSGDVGTGYSGVLTPTITYLLDLQEPASIGPKEFGRDKELKPLLRDEFVDPSSPQTVLQVFGQRFDNLFDFRCIHPRAAVAMRLAAWFKRFIKNNTPSLRSSGLNDLRFYRQEAERRTSRSGDDVAVQKVTCFVRTEELTLNEVSTIRHIDHRISIGLSQEAYQAIVGARAEEVISPFTGIYDQTGSYLWMSHTIDDNRATGIPSSVTP